MPPSNAGYYEVAYAVAIVVYTLYTITLWRRRSRVRRALTRELEGRGSEAQGR